MSITSNRASTPAYADFRAAWLEDIVAGEPSTVELGRRFAHKLVRQWLDADIDDLEVIYCDGAGDGGIDVAVLRRGGETDADGDDEGLEGDTWYLVQSKYGSAFQGTATLLAEGHKVMSTLDGGGGRRSGLAIELLERLAAFRAAASERDRLVLVFATEDPLGEDALRTLEDLAVMGRARLGAIFEVQAVSIDTVFRRQLDLEDAVASDEMALPIRGALAACGPDLLVGALPLLELYAFMKAFQRRTGDLDRLYEKNIRRFLGVRGKVNKSMQATLREAPEQFGLYNNGITIVVEDFRLTADGAYDLVDPFVVNGCQTTRSVWEVCRRTLESGGTGRDPAMEEWRERASSGVVIAKVVKVGEQGEALLEAITRYTNTQNAVREKDFLSLTKDFKTWAEALKQDHGLFLEVQRGDWDSYRALQRQQPDLPTYTHHANAFDLLKIYGAGWLRMPGRAFGGSRAFVPGSPVFRLVTGPDHPFGADDLRAAWILHAAESKLGYGRGATAKHRRQTRFVFYFVAIELLRRVVSATDPEDCEAITKAVLALADAEDRTAFDAWVAEADATVEEYMNAGMPFSAFSEPGFTEVAGGDLNAFLKSERLGTEQSYAPGLINAIHDHFRMLGRGMGGAPSPKAAIEAVLRG